MNEREAISRKTSIKDNMKPLVTGQRIMTWLCLLPAKENTNKWEKRAYIAFVLAFILILLAAFTGSLLYLLKCMSVDLIEALFGFYQTVGLISVINSIVVAFFIRHKIPFVYKKLSKLYEKHKDEDSFRFMAQANNKSEWLWNIYFKLSSVFVIVVAAAMMVSILICYLLNGHFDATQVFRPLKFIFPWDQTILLGYFGEIIFNVLSTQAYFVYNGTLLLTFVSICLHHQAFYKMFCHSLGKLNNPDEHRNDRKILCEIIQFHNSTISWFSMTADIFSPHLMVQLLCYVLILAAYILQLDQLLFKHFDLNEFIYTSCVLSNILLALFLFCFLGKLASQSYYDLADAFYDCNWYDVQLNLQKHFILMIANAQIPQNYHGYGIVLLNLETFCGLIRAVVSYYMMFKTLE